MIFQQRNPSETWTHPPTSIVVSDFWNFFSLQSLIPYTPFTVPNIPVTSLSLSWFYSVSVPCYHSLLSGLLQTIVPSKLFNWFNGKNLLDIEKRGRSTMLLIISGYET